MWGWRLPERFGRRRLGLEAGVIVTIDDGKPVQFDHIFELADGGPDVDENVQPLDVPGHKAKSAKSTRDRAHVARVLGETCTRPKRKIPSRPFDKKWKRGFDGKVVRR